MHHVRSGRAPALRATRLAIALFFLLAAGHAFGASPLADHLRELCADLQQQGWTPPKDFSGKASAVIDIPGIAYFCNLERPLEGAGTGHAPLLQALITDSGNDPSVIFSADIWCAEDRGALATLADHVEKQLARVALQVPAEIRSATRDGRRHETVAQGLRFVAAPVDVDAQACARVPENGRGAVLMKIDVSIRPADGKPR